LAAWKKLCGSLNMMMLAHAVRPSPQMAKGIVKNASIERNNLGWRAVNVMVASPNRYVPRSLTKISQS